MKFYFVKHLYIARGEFEALNLLIFDRVNCITCHVKVLLASQVQLLSEKRDQNHSLPLSAVAYSLDIVEPFFKRQLNTALLN